jgi:hypothetical protein
VIAAAGRGWTWRGWWRSRSWCAWCAGSRACASGSPACGRLRACGVGQVLGARGVVVGLGRSVGDVWPEVGGALTWGLGSSGCVVRPQVLGGHVMGVESLEYLQRAIEGAPANPGRLASDLVGWWVADSGLYVCARCAGRIMARGCRFPEGEPVWERGVGSPGVCCLCSDAQTAGA